MIISLLVHWISLLVMKDQVDKSMKGKYTKSKCKFTVGDMRESLAVENKSVDGR